MMTVRKIESLMLIDDNKVDQMMYRRIIERSGLVESLEQFYFADEALAELEQSGRPKPNFILLDINMPRMDGFEFLERAKLTFGEDFSPVVIMLTTSLDPNDEDRARSFNVVVDLWHKPLTEDHLKALADLV